MDLTKLTINDSELGRMAGANGEIGRYVGRLGTRVQEQAKANIMSGASGIRERTGGLSQSIDTASATDGHGFFVEIGSDLPRSTYLEEGTVPHPINPRRARMLRSAADHPDPLIEPQFAVFHPGNQPMPFLATALEQVIDSV